MLYLQNLLLFSLKCHPIYPGIHVASGIDRHPDRKEIYFRLQIATG